MVRLRDVHVRQVDELLAHEAARAEVEARYLDGHPALFPGIAEAWTERLHEMQMATALVGRLAELDGAGSVELHGPEWVEARTLTLVRDLVEPARTVTLEKLDDGRQAFIVASGWLHSKLLSAEDGPLDAT
ncbi:MAG: hypothetical protein M5T61_17550 [Acidimicrobiia bacterium]|nr:hypothetical protein [Acidimicrobiia bacterium]